MIPANAEWQSTITRRDPAQGEDQSMTEISPEFPVDENAVRVPYDRLKSYMTSVFQAVGLPDADADGVATAITRFANSMIWPGMR